VVHIPPVPVPIFAMHVVGMPVTAMVISAVVPLRNNSSR
jgi:hypothetical protein